MRRKPMITINQAEEVSFFVERKTLFTLYDANFYEIVFPVKGAVEINSEGTKRIAENGSAVFISPNTKRRITLRAEDGEYLSVRVKPESVKEIFDDFDAESYQIFTSLDVYVCKIKEGHLSDIYDAIQNVHVAEDKLRSILLKKLCYSIFMPLIPFKVFNANLDVVQRALTVMNDVKNVSFRLPDVAEKVGCSEEYLVRCFKKAGLETPNTIFKRIKLRYAKSVLTSSKVSVSEVSALVGFRSVGHFNKLYCSEYGVCPGTDKTR